MKVSADGVNSAPHADSTHWFGPYDLRVGCYTGSVTFSNSPSFVTSINKKVGDSPQSAYTFNMPTSTLPWCAIISNAVTKSTGEVWLGDDAPLVPKTLQPYSKFDLLTTDFTAEYSFKLKSYYPGDMTHLSPSVTVSISCDSSIALYSSAVPNPQKIATFNSSSQASGFNLPRFSTAYNFGCPVSKLELSTSNTLISAPSGMKPLTGSVAVPSDGTKH